MAEAGAEVKDLEQYYKWQQEQKERANRSLDTLRKSLDGSVLNASMDEVNEAGDASQAAPPIPVSRQGETLRHTLKSHGVNVPNVAMDISLINPQDQSKASVPASTSKKQGSQPVTREELDSVLSNLTSYMRLLEGENNLLKGEKEEALNSVQRLQDENDELAHQASSNRNDPRPGGGGKFVPIRSQSPNPARGINESFTGDGLPPSGANRRKAGMTGAGAMDVSYMSDDEVLRRSQERGLTALDGNAVRRFQKDIGQVKTLYEAKARRLEDQIEFLKNQLAVAEQSNDSLRARSKAEAKHEALQAEGMGVEPGMCIKCAQHDAVVTATHSSLYMQKIERLNKEMGEMRDSVASYKRQCGALQNREMESYSQVKNAIQLVEQAQLEKTQALLELEQSKEETRRLQRRLEDATLETKQRIVAERDATKAETKREISALNEKLSVLVEDEARLRVELDKALVDKADLKKQLQTATHKLQDSYTNVNQVSESLRGEMAACITERDDMRCELQKAQRDFQQKERDILQDNTLMRGEIDELRRRLTVAEGNEANGKAELVQMTDYVGKLEREALHSQRSRDQMDAQLRGVVAKANDREAQLKNSLDQQQRKFETVTKDLEDLLASQNSLISKLRTECKFLLDQLQSLSFKYRSDVENLEGSVEELERDLKRRGRQVKQLEKDAVRHGRAHHRMKTHLTKLHSTSHTAQTQLVNMMVKQNSLLKDRNHLAEEVEFLRGEAIALLHPEIVQRGSLRPLHEHNLAFNEDSPRQGLSLHPLETERQVGDSVLIDDKVQS